MGAKIAGISGPEKGRRGPGEEPGEGLFTFPAFSGRVKSLLQLRLFQSPAGAKLRPGGTASARKDIMSRTCDICGKHTITGNTVSHAKNRTRRTWKPNLLKVKTELGGTTVTLKICARCLRSDYITKKV
jgi:large subunit ribosomal protein L28